MLSAIVGLTSIVTSFLHNASCCVCGMVFVTCKRGPGEQYGAELMTGRDIPPTGRWAIHLSAPCLFRREDLRHTLRVKKVCK